MCVLLRCQAFLIKEGFVSRKKTNKRYVSLSSGEKVEAIPTGGHPWRCEACNISVRTKQALEGHKTSKSHLDKVQEKEMRFGPAQPLLHFATKLPMYKHIGPKRQLAVVMQLAENKRMGNPYLFVPGFRSV